MDNKQTRVQVIKNSYTFSDLQEEELDITKEDVVNDLNQYVVVGEHTVFVGKYEGFSKESVVWVDAEGIDYGWGLGQFSDKDGNIDYEAVANKFGKAFLEDLESFKKATNGKVYIIKDEKADERYVLLVDTTELGEDEEAYNKVFFLANSIEDALREDPEE